ncbi:unnamed protein product [Dibothriocephalus latus]|uniref:ribonuclease Z n=1 Tax=Dibothriocephalus latus TaxID=60516 RepID=A0A3P7MYW5_DIBLA|nr:unnamed protein product [Dibothriocephalus latus]
MPIGYFELSNFGNPLAASCSTTSEAISIGRAMKAKFILLNHFSQRFARLPNFDTFQENIAPTFDFMRVSCCNHHHHHHHHHHLPRYIFALILSISGAFLGRYIAYGFTYV